MELTGKGDGLRVGIVARSGLPDAIKLAKRLLAGLKGEDVVLEPELASALGERGKAIGAMRADAIVTLGGDGTVLRALREAPKVPVLAINLGGRGFLASIKPADALHAVGALIAGKLAIVERERLAGEVDGKRLPDALNEVVVCSALVGKTISFDVLVDGTSVMEGKGDGVIVATPTGSTAYALAAGGPVLDRRLEAFVIVPICTSRPEVPPIVVPMSSRIVVKLTARDRKGMVVVDGKRTAILRPDQSLTLHRSESPAKFFGLRGFR